VELSGKPLAFSDLLGSRVRDQSGRALGRLYEVRAHRERGGAVVLDELIVGRRALWRRLRGPSADARGISWQSVVEIGSGEIVVRLPAPRY
jgi:sporulation protein YlmC with PRC-barrel domain